MAIFIRHVHTPDRFVHLFFHRLIRNRIRDRCESENIYLGIAESSCESEMSTAINVKGRTSEIIMKKFKVESTKCVTHASLIINLHH